MISNILPPYYHNPTEQDLNDFEQLLNCFKEEKMEEAYELIKSNPLLLRIKGAPFTRRSGRTALWILIYDRIQMSDKDFKLALQMIELDPYMDLNASPPKDQSISLWPNPVLRGLLELRQKSELRTQLLQYLLLCGAAVPDDLTKEQKLEVQEAKKSFEKVFACGQQMMKMRRIEGNVFANPPMPKEISERIALEAMFLKLYEEYPWLANFPREFVLERMGALISQKYQYLLQ